MPWYTYEARVRTGIARYYDLKCMRDTASMTSTPVRIDGTGTGDSSRGTFWVPRTDDWGYRDLIKREHRDNKTGLLCNWDGPSVETKRGDKYYFLDGVRVTPEVVTDKWWEDPQKIIRCGNTEVARILMERYGFERFLLDVNAKEVDSYTDSLGHPVRLYHVKLGSGFMLAFIHMMNSTQEEDGTYKPYVLTVPGNKNQLRAIRENMPWNERQMTYVPAPTSRFGHKWVFPEKYQRQLDIDAKYDPKSALSAMAWTWEMTAEEYAPLVQT